jgi:Coenzyme PQQ synthesis protein D (PqqD)
LQTGIRVGRITRMSDPAIRVSIPEDVLFRDLGDEAVILELAGGQYYGLDEVGTRMWMQLRDHGEVEAACRALLREYQVDESDLRRDLRDFVDQLASRRLLVLDEG